MTTFAPSPQRAAVWLLVTVGLASVATSQAAELSVPPGFEVEVVAGPPLVEHPLMACFDERGRLFVAEAAGVNLPSEALLEQKPNSIRLLEDSDGDGRFDRGQVFADQMTFPQGALWRDGALYVCSPPNLWKLEDTDGDGRCDRRTPLVGKFGFNGNAADIHGPFAGPDGWLYWCDGRHGHDIDQPDGAKTEGLAARIFRCRPDGSGLETVCGGGMDNPTELAFTAAGEPLATVNILLSRPQRVDAIVYGIEGGVYPYHECYREFRRTGELLPAVGPLGWVAVSGIVRYRGQALGDDLQGNFFTAQFNPHRVQRHVVEREQAGFRIRHEDFLTSTNHDFHPTDVLEDADGSLLVIDTGGWFRNGCPTSQIAKPEVTGAIYRVRRTGVERPTDPRGTKIAWSELNAAGLAALLDDPRPAVRDRAIAVAAARGDERAGVAGKSRGGEFGRTTPQRGLGAMPHRRSESSRSRASGGSPMPISTCGWQPCTRRACTATQRPPMP
ncbi:MAG: PVC-type heme-binding CxxCH protein [Pirellulales bacterium]